MPVIAKANGDFTPHPEGVFDAVAVDVTPLKAQQTMYGMKEKFAIVWETTAKMEDGRPFLVRKYYTPSLGAKSNLYRDLRSWRGKDFTRDELNSFEVDKVIGAACQLVIQHSEHEGNVYANIMTILKAAATKLRPSGKYVRVQDRPEYKEEQRREQEQFDRGNPPAPNGDKQEPDSNEDIPF